MTTARSLALLLSLEFLALTSACFSAEIIGEGVDRIGAAALFVSHPPGATATDISVSGDCEGDDDDEESGGDLLPGGSSACLPRPPETRRFVSSRCHHGPPPLLASLFRPPRIA